MLRSMRIFLALLLFLAAAPTAALAVPNVNVEITNATNSTIIATTKNTKCMEIPWKTTLPPKKLTKIFAQWNSYGNCKIDPSGTVFVFTAAYKTYHNGNWGMADLHHWGPVRVSNGWDLSVSGCLSKNGYDQIKIACGNANDDERDHH
jgi:hypothetical protein